MKGSKGGQRQKKLDENQKGVWIKFIRIRTLEKWVNVQRLSGKTHSWGLETGNVDILRECMNSAYKTINDLHRRIDLLPFLPEKNDQSRPSDKPRRAPVTKLSSLQKALHAITSWSARCHHTIHRQRKQR